MLSKLKKIFYKNFLPFFVARIGQGCIRFMLRTCSWEIKGLEDFKALAEKERCILMLWHNRLAMIPFILYKYAPHFVYAAFVSNSRDGELISAVVESYETGRTIRVSHHLRHKALREMIAHLKEKKEVIIITPDGPRGPRYEMKPGVALAAMETEAYVIPLEWSSNKMWEFKTWDKLRLPKPFSKITISFEPALQFNKQTCSLEQIRKDLQHALEPV